MRLLALPLLAAALALVVGCGHPSPPPPLLSASDVAAEALGAVERGDWAHAVGLLRTALRQDPTSVTLHYHLGIAASHLDLVDEATHEFRWIVANVAPELPQARVAQRWLADAGPRARPAPEVAPEEPEVAPELVTEETLGDSGVSGRVQWAEGQSTSRVQLFLKGAPHGPLEHLQWVLRTDDQGRFEFKWIPAGTYMLTDKIAGAPTWRLRVRLPPGENITLDLSEANSADVQDDFPGA
jgi:hypothetical protein